jgi:hypothetical protein
MKKTALIVAASTLLAGASPSFAAKGIGCDGFLWPLTTELAWLQASNPEKAASGSSLSAPPSNKAIELALQPVSLVKFAAPPTKTPKPEDAATFGGVINFDEMPEAGQY